MGEYVMVPREQLQAAYDETMDTRYHQEWMCAILTRPAEEHRGEPVAWVHPAYLKPGAIGFEASVTRLADAQVPLYTHADPGEVERLRDKLTKINELIFATGAPLGGDVYFQIREICAEELRYEVRHV